MVAPLTGLGLMIWELHRCEGGDLDKILARAKSVGASWICVKAGESHDNGQITVDLVTRVRDEGIEIAGWWYSRPATAESEVELAKRLVYELGVYAIFADMESEWESTVHDGVLHPFDWRKKAAEFANNLRQAVGTEVCIGDMPWPIKRAHPLFPFDEFGAICQMRCPQAYYEVAVDGGESATRFLDDGDKEWATSAVPVCPIISPINDDGSKHAPLSDFATALDRYSSRQAMSVWSWDSLNRAEWALLESRAARATSP